MPNNVLSYDRKTNVKYEVIKFEALHNEVKNCIQEVLCNAIAVHVPGILYCLLWQVFFVPIRSISVIVKVADYF